MSNNNSDCPLLAKNEGRTKSNSQSNGDEIVHCNLAVPAPLSAKVFPQHRMHSYEDYLVLVLQLSCSLQQPENKLSEMLGVDICNYLCKPTSIIYDLDVKHQPYIHL